MTKRTKCKVTPVGKRRDGGTRYWCTVHRADATAKYGKPADFCRYAHVPPVQECETFVVDVDEWPGGIALWGAVPPVYDTTSLGLDRGIHVHARKAPGASKCIDTTYRRVRVVKGASTIEVGELDAIYFMVSSVFGFPIKFIPCTLCGHPHLDRDWFSVHPHQRHLCAGCGYHFRDTERAIGNPVASLQALLGAPPKAPKKSSKKLEISQADFPGGIQVWGSNAAIVWTGVGAEEEGIHVHAFTHEKMAFDDTFASVTIDGVRLNPEMVRTLMAQSAMPHIGERVVDLACTSCGAAFFASGEAAYAPNTTHSCRKCSKDFASRGRLRNVIGNPLIGVLERLARSAPRPPVKHDLGLIPETI